MVTVNLDLMNKLGQMQRELSLFRFRRFHEDKKEYRAYTVTIRFINQSDGFTADEIERLFRNEKWSTIRKEAVEDRTELRNTTRARILVEGGDENEIPKLVNIINDGDLFREPVAFRHRLEWGDAVIMITVFPKT